MRASLVIAATSLFSVATAIVASQNMSQLPPRGGFKIKSHRGSAVDGLTENLVPTDGGEPEPEGTGCANGSTYSTISEDGTVLTILFDNFQAAIGGKTARPDRRKFCTVDLGLTIPQGYTFAVDNIDWRGYVHMDGGVGGRFATKFGFADVKRKAVIKKQLVGPLTQSYLYHAGDDTVVKSEFLPCTRNQETQLTINTAIALRYPGRGKERVTSGSGLITVDSIDGKLQQVLNLKWQQCPH